MKKAVVLVLVLIVVFSSHLLSETLDCQQSFELGNHDAKEEHKVLGWYLLGIASGVSFMGIGWLLMDVDPASVNPWVEALAGVGITVAIIGPFVPALRLPKRENISPPFGEGEGVDAECYRNGYVKRARTKNCGALLLGGLTVLAGVSAGAVVAILTFAFRF